jgi:hypothetical protein
MTGLAFRKVASSPPHITVNTPFSAPAWPPETGASMKCRPLALQAASSSRATSAEAVVLSMRVAPGFMPSSTPSLAVVTERKSSSLPTQVKTKSASFAASAGVRNAVPPNSAAHFSALAKVRL